MALPSSGAIRMGADVNVELGSSSTTQISLGQSTVRTLYGVSSGGIRLGTDGYGKSSLFSFTISSNQTDSNLRTLAINAGWNGTAAVQATISSGIVLSASSTGTPALTVSGSFPAGVTLINNGYIVGKGGAGGNGGSSSGRAGSAGSAGGTALTVSTACSINNAGTIGGGGGGGGGGATTAVLGGAGGGGGGGAGFGTGGAAGSRSGGVGSVTAGSPGTLSSGGGGGSGAGDGRARSAGGNGGTGGNLGSSGSSGTGSADGSYGGQGPGSAGNAVTGNSNITWLATGTRLGTVA
jgi:hypothetical protein